MLTMEFPHVQTGWLHPTINVEDQEEEVTMDTCTSGKVEHKVS